MCSRPTWDAFGPSAGIAADGLPCRILSPIGCDCGGDSVASGVRNSPDSFLYACDAVSRLKEISHLPSHGQSVRNVSTMSYWDNGWNKTTSPPVRRHVGQFG